MALLTEPFPPLLDLIRPLDDISLSENLLLLSELQQDLMDDQQKARAPRRRVPAQTGSGGGRSPRRQSRGGSPNSPSRGRSRGASTFDRIRDGRIGKPAPRHARGGRSPNPATFAPGRSPPHRTASPRSSDLADYIRDARATLAIGRGPVVVGGGGSRPAGFLSPGWSAKFEGPDGWTYESVTMFMLASWAYAAADGRVPGLPDVESDEKLSEEEKETAHRTKYTRLWKRIIQSTNARLQASMCASAGLNWATWKHSKIAISGCIRSDAAGALVAMENANELKFDNPRDGNSRLLREGLLATKDREIVYVRARENCNWMLTLKAQRGQVLRYWPL
jgi:hypothetical protein